MPNKKHFIIIQIRHGLTTLGLTEAYCVNEQISRIEKRCNFLKGARWNHKNSTQQGEYDDLDKEHYAWGPENPQHVEGCLDYQTGWR